MTFKPKVSKLTVGYLIIVKMGIKERKQREKKAREKLILKAAEEIFFKQGEEKMTMDAVAEKAEISKPTIYAYFKNKDELYVAIALKILKLLHPFIKKNLKKDLNGLEKIKSIIQIIFRFFQKFPKYSNFFLNYSSQKAQALSPANSAIVKDFYLELNAILGLLHQSIKQGKQDQSCSKEVETKKAVLIIDAATLGMLKVVGNKENQKELSERFDTKPDEMLEYYLQFIERALKT